MYEYHSFWFWLSWHLLSAITYIVNFRKMCKFHKKLDAYQYEMLVAGELVTSHLRG